MGLFFFAALALGPALPARASSTEAILTEVSHLVAQREFVAALELFDSIEEDSAEIRLLRASLLNSAGRPADARAIASGIVANDPGNVDALMVLAASALVEGRDRDQRLFLEQALRSEPENLQVITELGYNALRARSLRAAAGHFDSALAIDPGYPQALVGRAIVYRYERNPRRAEDLLNRAISENPGWAVAYHERARLYRGAGFREHALRDLNEAARLDPGNHWISVDRGITLMELGLRQEALAELDRSIALFPNNFLAHVHRASLREAVGDLEGAAQDHMVVMRLRPDYFFAAEGLGIIRMKQGRYLEARDAFLAAHRQAPREHRYALLAAANWMRGGRMQDPRQFLAQVMRSVERDSPEWFLMRLYHDLSGDNDVIARIRREPNLDMQAMMMFYLALFYDVRGNVSLANSFFMQVHEMGRRGMVEWSLNEWFIEQRGLGF